MNLPQGVWHGDNNSADYTFSNHANNKNRISEPEHGRVDVELGDTARVARAWRRETIQVNPYTILKFDKKGELDDVLLNRVPGIYNTGGGTRRHALETYGVNYDVDRLSEKTIKLRAYELWRDEPDQFYDAMLYLNSVKDTIIGWEAGEIPQYFSNKVQASIRYRQELDQFIADNDMDGIDGGNEPIWTQEQAEVYHLFTNDDIRELVERPKLEHRDVQWIEINYPERNFNVFDDMLFEAAGLGYTNYYDEISMQDGVTPGHPDYKFHRMFLPKHALSMAANAFNEVYSQTNEMDATGGASNGQPEYEYLDLTNTVDIHPPAPGEYDQYLFDSERGRDGNKHTQPTTHNTVDLT